MIKKINIFLVLLLLLLSISVVSAADDGNSTAISSDEAISDIAAADTDYQSVDVANEEVLTSASHRINSSNYGNYFNPKSGDLISSSVNAGDTIEIDGSFNGRAFVFRTPVNVVGTSTNDLKNCNFTFYSGASGSSVSNLKIKNTNSMCYGIFLNNASNCVIHGCFINNTGASSYAICIANTANYNNVSNNILNTYGMTYGHGTRSTPALLLCNAHYNYIGGNHITCDDANAIYLSSFEGGPLKGGESFFNTIHNNTIKYNVLPTSWAYGIQVMGGNNTVSSNRIIGAYRGISTNAPGNVIIDNMLINLTGADYNNPGVPSGAEIGIVGSYHSIIRNNQIINAKIISTGTGISALDGSIVENNYVQVSLPGKGIYPQGSNITIKNNTIITDSGSGILYNVKAYNLRVLDNNISSNTGVGVLIQKVSDKKMPGNITIVGNTIATGNKYAIDAAEADASTVNVIGPNNIKKGCEVRTPEGSYDPSKPVYVFNGTVHNINPSNYGDYINDNGGLSSDIKDGDILNFSGEFNDKVIFINSAIKITGDNPTFYNTTFRVRCDGVLIENLVIKNNKASRLNAWGILIYKVSGARVTNCDIEVYDPNAAYAIYVVESTDVDILNNKLFSSGDYLTYTLLAYETEDCNFTNNTINTLGTGVVHVFENQHCLDGDTNCLDGDTNCLDGDTNCLDGDTNCLDGDTNCLDGSFVGEGNHVLTEVYRTYGIIMAYSSGATVSRNIVTVTSKLNGKVSPYNSTNSIVGIDSYFNCQNNMFSDNEIYINAYDNYIYGMGVLGYTTGHNAPEGQGAINNSFINNYIVINGTYCVEGIIIGHESHDTIIENNIIDLKSDNVAYGITLEMSQKSTITDNYLALNSDVIYGVEAYSSNNNTMRTNELELNGKQVYGILFSNSNNNSVISNIILANGTGEKISFQNFDSIKGGNTGIFLRSKSTNNEITKNTITSNKEYAILVDDEAINNVITENYLDSEKGTGDLAVSNSKNNVVENNYRYTFSGKLSTIRAKYLDPIVMNLNVDDGAYVKFYINDNEIGSAISSNGVATLNYKLDASLDGSGNYYIRAVASKYNYLTKEYSARLIISATNLNVILNNATAKTLDYGTFSAIVRDNFGNPLPGILVKFYRDYVTNSFIGEATTDSNGIAMMESQISTPEGSYPISANVAKVNGKFNAASAQAINIVNNSAVIKENTVISAPDVTVAYKDTTAGLDATLVSVHGTPLKLNVNVNFNGESYTIKADSNGKIHIPTSTLAPGTYVATISYNGNSNYNPTTTTANVIVTRADTVISASDVNVSYKDANGKLVATITNAYGKALSVYVVVNINGQNYTIKADSNGKINIPTSTWAPGTYVATIFYAGNVNYNPSTAVAKVVVDKADTFISANNVTVVYKDADGKLVATITNAYGKALSVYVDVNINGQTYTIKADSTGKVILPTSDIDSGRHFATIFYNGNVNYNPSSTTAKVVVAKANTKISAKNITVAFKDTNEKVIATLTNVYGEAVSDNVNVNINGKTYTVKADSNGKIRVPTSTLAPGTYVATISYKGNGNYKASSATSNVVVTKANTVITASDVTVAYKDANGKLVATITNAYGKALSVDVDVKINGKTSTIRADSNGKINIPTSTLSPGTYVATISYKGNVNYKPSSTTVNVVVTKANTVITAPNVSVSYKDTTNKTIGTITNAYGDALSVYVNVTLNEVKYAVRANSNGQIKVSTANLAPGTYTATISYKGNGNYNPVTKTTKITVNKANTVITASDVSVAYKDANGKLVATITNAYGKALSVYVNVNLNGETYSLRADSKGKISVSTAGLAPGTYTATITYDGNGNYKASSTTAQITVNKADTLISAQDISVTYKDADGKLVATITNAYGKALGVNVDVNINGKTYTVKADSNGKINIPTSTLVPGSYVATISYKGNVNYNPSSTTANVVVTKADTVISASDVTVNCGDSNGKLVATITNEYGNPLGVKVTVDINGETYTVKANANGQITVPTAGLAAGNYAATITYQGNVNYNPTSTTANITVKP